MKFPDVWKEAPVLPRLTKYGLDRVFGIIVLLSFLCFQAYKKSAADKPSSYMSIYGIFPVLHSKYRQYHSTKTALLKVKNDILMNMKKGHVTLTRTCRFKRGFRQLKRLQRKVGVTGKALAWFSPYLKNRPQRGFRHGTVSTSFSPKCGVPQGSCLGPLRFNTYISK